MADKLEAPVHYTGENGIFATDVLFSITEREAADTHEIEGPDNPTRVTANIHVVFEASDNNGKSDHMKSKFAPPEPLIHLHSVMGETTGKRSNSDKWLGTRVKELTSVDGTAWPLKTEAHL